jgi:hypothetical protein
VYVGDMEGGESTDKLAECLKELDNVVGLDAVLVEFDRDKFEREDEDEVAET